MPMAKESETINRLTTAREPSGPKADGDAGTIGDSALRDALIIICVCIAFLFFLGFSLRSSNV